MRSGDGRGVGRCAERGDNRSEVRLLPARDRVDGLEHRELRDGQQARPSERALTTGYTPATAFQSRTTSALATAGLHNAQMTARLAPAA